MVFRRASLYFLMVSLFISLNTSLLPSQSRSVNAGDFQNENSSTAGIQEAVDALPAEGGTVFIPAGMYEITRSIRLRTGVRIQGEGHMTVITRRAPYLQVILSAPAYSGSTAIRVQSTAGFEAGFEICLQNDKAFYRGRKTSHPVISDIDGNILTLEKPLTMSHPPDGIECDVYVFHSFPVFYAADASLISIQELTIDGKIQESAGLKTEWTAAAIYFDRVKDCYISKVHVKNFPSDGISMQAGENATVTDCIAEYNLGCGFHPGTRINGGSWTNNVGRYNRDDGLYFCQNVHNTIVEGSRFYGNGRSGIGNLGYARFGPLWTDHYNIVSNNICYNNGRSGIECLGGGNNIVVNNICKDNSQMHPGRWPGILVDNTHSTIIRGNRCMDTQSASSKTQGYGILVRNHSANNTITGNILSGHRYEGISGDALNSNIVKDNITLTEHVLGQAFYPPDSSWTQ